MSTMAPSAPARPSEYCSCWLKPNICIGRSKPVPEAITAEARHAWNVQSTPTLCQYQNTGVHQIAAGGEHTFVITESGELVAFGEGNHGQIGAPGAHAERSQATEYKAVKVPLEQQAREIACGIHHTVAVGTDGEVRPPTSTAHCSMRSAMSGETSAALLTIPSQPSLESRPLPATGLQLLCQCQSRSQCLSPNQCRNL